MRRYFIYLISILVIAAIVAAIYSALSNRSSALDERNGGGEPIGTARPFNRTWLALPEMVEIGTSRGVVAVNNFYRRAISQEDTSVLFLKEDNKYFVSYDTFNSSFWINVLSSQGSDTIRRRAEADLLEVLGINQEEACKLRVAVTVPADAGLPGRNLGLSFCPR